jgi:hypothetical protein
MKIVYEEVQEIFTINGVTFFSPLFNSALQIQVINMYVLVNY